MSSSYWSRATALYKRATTKSSTGEYERPADARIPLLEEAFNFYSSAMNKTSTMEANGRLLISKNLAMASLRLAQALVEAQKKKDCKRAIYYVNEAVRNLSHNWLCRPDERTLEWGTKVKDAINAAFETALQCFETETENWPQQLHQLDTVVESICSSDSCLDTFRLRFYIERGNFFQRTAGKSIQMNNFVLAERLLEYCRCDLESGFKFETDSTQLQALEKMIEFLRASCQSVKLRIAADDLLEKCLSDQEQINFEVMWDILDMYKAAALAASKQDLMNETIAIAKQGILFHKIFKLETHANKYCHKAVEIGNIMMCLQEAERCSWYVKSLKVIDECQRRAQEKEDKETAQERSPFLEMLKDELAELKAVGSDYVKLLRHIYSKHPPQIDPNFKYDETAISSQTVKKILVKAIFHYHPDKQAGFERKWKVLCEEITKHVTFHYEHLKGI